MPLVVRLVVRSVGDVQFAQTRNDLFDVRVAREIDKHRTDLGAQEMIGARCAEFGQVGALRACDEIQDLIGVIEMADLSVIGGG